MFPVDFPRLERSPLNSFSVKLFSHYSKFLRLNRKNSSCRRISPSFIISRRRYWGNFVIASCNELSTTSYCIIRSKFISDTLFISTSVPLFSYYLIKCEFTGNVKVIKQGCLYHQNPFCQKIAEFGRKTLFF